ncbi:acyl-CoA dehydrogenase family protein [Pseudonocardia spinosispora]|uniref:acyl-CoA dehydrogenase family protein n=1 Tax=Pseudonocardia spinosispora TaxID=103441 RepID=UPI00040D5476|nr:acyl-CoA dehydrogenase family protein [Pseudonocardia spinosispora]
MTGDVLDDAARDCAELASVLALDTEQRRALAPKLVDRLKDSGLLRCALPAEHGGPGASPAEILRAAETVARGDASAGWCVSINATSGLLAGYLPASGAAEVFGDPRSVACGVWAPRGRATRVDGGLSVSGQWGFCSGVTHSDWMFGGVVVGETDPVIRVVAMPVSELRILDTWHTSGLRGTGSHDVVADQLFIPERRVLSVLEGPGQDAAALHRFPIFGFFGLSIAVAALGNARAAIDDLIEVAGAKRSLGSSRTLAERTQTQADVARAEAALRAARLLVYDAVDQAWLQARGSAPVSEQAKLDLRMAATHATRTSAEVAASMYDLGGASAIYEGSSLQRRFRDAHTATAHFQVNPATYELFGRILLGLPTRTEQL